MQNIAYSPFIALNNSTVEPKTVLNSAVSRAHSEKYVPTSPNTPPPRIDPDIIIVSDSDSKSSSPIKNYNDAFPTKNPPGEYGNTSPVLWAGTRKQKELAFPSKAVNKKSVKKNKSSMKVSRSLFQKNPKQARTEKDTSSVQQQVELSGASSYDGKISTSGPTDELNTTTVKRAPVIMLNDVLPNLNKEQLRQLQFHEESCEIHTNSSQGKVDTPKPKNDSIIKESASGVSELDYNPLENTNDFINKNISSVDSSADANASRNGYMIRRSPGQLPNTSFYPCGKKKYINYGAGNNTTDGDENQPSKHKSHLQLKNDISHLLQHRKYKLKQRRDRKKLKRPRSTVTLYDGIVSDKNVATEGSQLLDEIFTTSEKSVGETESSGTTLGLHKRKKKKHQKLKKRHISEHNPDGPKQKVRGRKPMTKNKKYRLVRGRVTANPVVDSLCTPGQEHGKRLQSRELPHEIGVSEGSTDSAFSMNCSETDLPEISFSQITSVTDKENSVKSTVMKLDKSPLVQFKDIDKKHDSNKPTTSSLRPILERLSPEKRILTHSPEKVYTNQASENDTVTLELEKVNDTGLQDKTVLKRNTINTKPSFKKSHKTKLPVIKKQKQKRSKTTGQGKTDMSKLSPGTKRKLRKRKPVFYAEDEMSYNHVLKPAKVPKVSKERRFQHICLKERKDIHEIVIAVEAADEPYCNTIVPRQYNFLFVRTLNELITAFQMSLQNEKCKAVILSSVGPVFCSGLDPFSLLNWSSEQPVAPEDIIELMTQLVNILIRYSKPIIAIVQGPAVGFGATLLLHCDSVYASDRASLQWPFTQIGLPPFGCTTESLNQTVGLSRTRSLLLEGRIISAQTAKDLGIVTEVFRHESLHANAWPLCCTLRQQSQSASIQTKQLVNINFIKSQVECNDCETSHLKRCLKMPSSEKYLKRYLTQHLCPN